MYFAWNGATRALIEGLRTDSLYIGGMRVSQVLGAVCAVLSIIAIALIRNKIKCSATPEKFIPYGHTEECKAQLAEIDEKRRLAKCKPTADESVDDSTDIADDCVSNSANEKSENTGESHDKSNEKTE
jgi:phosphatidylglycerol---prolipoprotein diacylglyceryl transferase